MTNKGVRMGFWIDRILLPLFIVALKTKRVARSAVNGKINYHVRKYSPYFIGILIALWTVFIYFI